MTRPKLSTWDGAALRAAIERRGWTMARLAVELDVAEARVNRWVYGATPEPAMLVALGRALGMDTTALAPLSAAPTLLERRWHAGHSVASLAATLDLNEQYVGRLLRGGQPISVESLPQWAKALNIPEEHVQRAWENTRRALRTDADLANTTG